MKKILLFLFLLTSVFLRGQVGTYEVYFVGWLEGASNHHCGKASVEMTLNSGAGNEIKKIFEAEYGENSPRQYFNKNNTLSTFSANKSLSKLYFSTTRYQRSSCRGTRHHNSGSLSSGLNVSCYTLAFQFSQFTNEDTDGNGLWNSSFTLYIRPKLVIVDNDPSNNFLPTEERTTINSHSNFKYAEYNWQYRINGSGWVSLPQYNGQSSITINAKDILGNNAGVIWRVLTERETLTLKQISELTGFRDPALMMALGWLARENKIYFIVKGDSLIIELNSFMTENYY